MPLKDLVVYLGNRGATGLLTIDRDPTRKQIALDQGNVVNVSSNEPREFLGQFFINLGHINEEQFNRAFETQKETKIFLGRILVMIGLISEEVLNTVLSLKFRETLLEPFQWEDGEFSFEPGEPKTVDGLDLRIPLLEIHKESDFRDVAWQQIRQAFPSGNVALELRRQYLAVQPKPGSLDEKLLKAVEDGQTIDEMALSLHAADFFLYQRLYALHRLQAVAVRTGKPAEPVIEVETDLGLGDSPSADDLLSNARAFLGQGQFRDAYVVAKQSQGLTATIDAQLLVKEIEQAWLPQLKANFLSARKVPKAKVKDAQLKQLSLTAPERYLMSRLDGARDLESIMRVAPLKEFEVLLYFDRFVSQGWVTFG